MDLHRRRGAPDGNQNRLKHGRYSAAALARRKRVRETIRSAQQALFVAKLAIAEDGAISANISMPSKGSHVIMEYGKPVAVITPHKKARGRRIPLRGPLR